MFKYLFAGAALLMLSACNGAVLPPPPATLPAAPADITSVDNTELCASIAENEKNLQSWISWAGTWGNLVGIDVDAKITEYTSDIDLLKDAAETRNVACK